MHAPVSGRLVSDILAQMRHNNKCHVTASGRRIGAGAAS
jgi:hypothetical protein